MPAQKNKRDLGEQTSFSVYAKLWTLRSENSKYQQWSSDWFCTDGDSAELYIHKDMTGFTLSCFSGIGGSEIIINDIDFGTLWRGIFKERIGDVPIQNCTHVQKSIILADCFCSLFCEHP